MWASSPPLSVSNNCALSDADRTLLIQVPLIITAIERKMPMCRIVKKQVLNPTEILGCNTPDDKRDPRNGFVCGIRCVEIERASRTPRTAARAIDKALSK